MTDRQWKIGDHFLRSEPDDVFYFAPTGTFNIDDAQRVLPLLRDQFSKRPLYLLLDARKFESLTPDARSEVIQHFRPEWVRACVYVGTNLLMRMVITGINAVLFLRGTSFPIEFVSTMEEAPDAFARLRIRGAT